MSENIIVHPRINMRHPNVTGADVRSAWWNAIVVVDRSGGALEETLLVAIGMDAKGRLLEMVGAVTSAGAIEIFHAMTPPSAKTIRECGLEK